MRARSLNFNARAPSALALYAAREHKSKRQAAKLTSLLSPVFTGLVIFMIATPKLQRMPKEMRKPIEERTAIW